MEHDPSAAGWQFVVRQFAAALDRLAGYYSVKDLCTFLQEGRWAGRDEVAAYLDDYLRVSEARLAFHRKWSHLRNFENLAEHDCREIAKVGELLRALSET